MSDDEKFDRGDPHQVVELVDEDGIVVGTILRGQLRGLYRVLLLEQESQEQLTGRTGFTFTKARVGPDGVQRLTHWRWEDEDASVHREIPFVED